MPPYRMQYGENGGQANQPIENHRYHIEIEVNNPMQNAEEADPNNPGAKRAVRKSIE